MRVDIHNSFTCLTEEENFQGGELGTIANRKQPQDVNLKSTLE